MKDLSYFRRIFFDLGTVKTLGAFRNLLRRWVWDCWPSQFISSGWIFPTPINFKSYTEKKVNIFLKLYILEKIGLSTVGLRSFIPLSPPAKRTFLDQKPLRVKYIKFNVWNLAPISVVKRNGRDKNAPKTITFIRSFIYLFIYLIIRISVTCYKK